MGSWSDFRAARPAARVVHLDSAAAARSSVGTLRAVAEHAELEAETGAYVAQDLAAEVIADGRARLAGLLGVEPDGLVFTESATESVATLLSVWPLAEGDTVAVVPSEWGPNLAAFIRRGLRIHELPVTADGTVDTDALSKLLADAPPAFVHLTQVASHRPLVQPVAAALEICRAAGVPLWVDAAQALGHVDTASGADVIYAPSRKWLTGPRGVGLLGVNRRWWDKLEIVPPRLTDVRLPLRAGSRSVCDGCGASTPNSNGPAVGGRHDSGHDEPPRPTVWRIVLMLGLLSVKRRVRYSGRSRACARMPIVELVLLPIDSRLTAL